MGLTPDQQKAQDDLQVAIENHVQVFRYGSDRPAGEIEITGDWLIVASVTAIDSDQERRYSYQMAFSGGEQPEHVALGLLEMGKQLIGGSELRGPE